MSQNKLNEIDVRNFKRVRRAHLSIEGNTLVISGFNEEGKSSFLDAITALFGGKDKMPSVAVRKGAKEAVVIGNLSTADGRKLTAKATFGQQGKRRVVVTDESGKQVSSPQELLNSFWDEASFDPSLFLASKERDQLAMLMTMAGLDFMESDAESARIFSERTSVNRSAEQVNATITTRFQSAYEDAPDEEVSVSQLLEAINKADAINKEKEDAVRAAGKEKDDLEAKDLSLRQAIKEVSVLNSRLSVANAEVDLAEKAVKAAATRESEQRELAESLPTAEAQPLRDQAASAEETNRKVRFNKERTQMISTFKAHKAQSDKMSREIEDIAEKKEELIRNSKFPVKGLSLTETGVMFDGLPLSQASDSRKIAIGVEMAAAMNPDKPLMLVRHGNLFTEKNFSILQEVAERRNLTVIIEIAGEKRADSSLHFQDGVGDDGTPQVDQGPESISEEPAAESKPEPKQLDLPPSI